MNIWLFSAAVHLHFLQLFEIVGFLSCVFISFCYWDRMSGVQSKNEAQYFNHVLKSQMEWNMFITSDGWSNGCLTCKCQCHVANEMASSYLRRTEKHIYCGRMGIWDAFNTSYNNIWYLTKIDVVLFYLEIGNHFEYWKPGLSTLSIGRIDPHVLPIRK